MPETDATITEGQDDNAGANGPETGAETTDWKAEAEKWRALSRKNEDNAKSNAEKAKQFDKLTESQKSEQQKLNDAAAQAQKDAESARAELAIERAARKHGLTDDDLEILGTHGTPEEIDARAERLANRLKATKPQTDFGGGKRGTDSSEADLDQQIAAATKAGKHRLAIQLKQQKAFEAKKSK